MRVGALVCERRATMFTDHIGGLLYSICHVVCPASSIPNWLPPHHLCPHGIVRNICEDVARPGPTFLPRTTTDHRPCHLSTPRTTSLTEIHFRDIFGVPCSPLHPIIPTSPHLLSQRIVSSFPSASPAKFHWFTMSYPCSNTIPPFPSSLPVASILNHYPRHLRSDMQLAHSYPLLPPNGNPAF